MSKIRAVKDYDYVINSGEKLSNIVVIINQFEVFNDLYDIYLLPYGWKCYKLAEVVKACQGKNKNMAEEFIWINYELPDSAKYVISMKEYSSL